MFTQQLLKKSALSFTTNILFFYLLTLSTFTFAYTHLYVREYNENIPYGDKFTPCFKENAASKKTLKNYYTCSTVNKDLSHDALLVCSSKETNKSSALIFNDLQHCKDARGDAIDGHNS